MVTLDPKDRFDACGFAFTPIQVARNGLQKGGWRHCLHPAVPPREEAEAVIYCVKLLSETKPLQAKRDNQYSKDDSEYIV